MKISKNSMVTLKYSVTDIDGNVVDDGSEPIVYLHGGYEDMFKKIEDELEGKEVGGKCNVTLEPQDAFGDFDDELVVVEPRGSFGDDLHVGMQVEGEMDGEVRIFTVTDMADGKVVLDGNHPLAGLHIIFSCEVISVRAASKEEISQKQ